MDSRDMRCPACGGYVASWVSTSFGDGHAVQDSGASCHPIWTIGGDEPQRTGCGWKGKIDDTYGWFAARRFDELGEDAAFARDVAADHPADRLRRLANGLNRIATWMEAKAIVAKKEA